MEKLNLILGSLTLILLTLSISELIRHKNKLKYIAEKIGKVLVLKETKSINSEKVRKYVSAGGVNTLLTYLETHQKELYENYKIELALEVKEIAKKTTREIEILNRKVAESIQLLEVKEKQINELRELNNNEVIELKESHNRVIKEYEKCIKEKDTLYESLLDIKDSSLAWMAVLFADHALLQFKITEDYLRNKRPPAIVKAAEVKDLKTTSRFYITKFKQMEYRYSYLLSLFPELEDYLDSADTLKELSLSITEDISELQEDFDKALSYLSKEEYNSLPVEERDQLALERYIVGRKSKWQIGRDYEMYVGHYYEKLGYEVIYFGIDRSLSDLGRDLILRKDNTIRIVQCKYWAREKQIHEKHIAQLYGTTVEYIMSHIEQSTLVIPVFVTNIRLSETAKRFAEYLKVEIVEDMPLGEFPRIKCNINSDEDGFDTRIYHLPFDQQYDRTKINKYGEFYAFTVQEAILKGFRRAKKFYGSYGG